MRSEKLTFLKLATVMLLVFILKEILRFLEMVHVLLSLKLMESLHDREMILAIMIIRFGFERRGTLLEVIGS